MALEEKSLFLTQVCRKYNLTLFQLQRLLVAAGLREERILRGRYCLFPSEYEQIAALLNSYTFMLGRGTPFQRVCRCQRDIAEFYQVSYPTFTHWMRQFGFADFLPSKLGRNMLLPNEVETIINGLAGHVLSGKGGIR